MKRIVLWSCFALTLACFLGVYYFLGIAGENPPKTPPGRGVAMSTEERVVASLVSDSIHRERARQRVEELKRESLDETFAKLNDGAAYIPKGILYGGLNSRVSFVQLDLLRIFSNRGFLKVFQDVKKMPREEALSTIDKFWGIAVSAIEKQAEFLVLQHKVKTDSTFRERYEVLKAERYASLPNNGMLEEIYLCYMPMLLTAYLGETELLVNQMSEAQRLIEERVDLTGKTHDVEHILQTDVLLTILMYAAQQAGIDVSEAMSEANIPFNDLAKNVIPLFPWDAEWTYYDYPVFQGGIRLDPKDADELFTFYRIPYNHFSEQSLFDTREQRIFIDTLKDVLSR